MTESQAKLKALLRELFQLDHADLDFGIYRIMNAKRDEIERFLDNDLLPQVKKAFEQYQSSDSAAVRAELEKLITQLKDAGVDPESSTKVRDLRAKLATAVDVTTPESQVFSDLYNFFRRYYSEGDFLSLRRYKEGVYAIPYEGEEVKLYWANHDQYYIKSSEYLRDYRFKVAGSKYVHFKVVEADAEKDNNKAASGNDRRFILTEENPVSEENGELVIRFEYKCDPDKRKQDALNEAAAESILAAKGIDAWYAALTAAAPSNSDPKPSVLAKHLTDYTARNTFDYFIHKDLGAFLRRELDFFIKNEVMHLDDIESAALPKIEEIYSRIRILRIIAHKIITFLAQVEDFQKKLWLKKKFVVDCHYLVTLDRVPKKLFDTIAANKAQWTQWESLGFKPSIDAAPSLLHGPKWGTRDYLDATLALVVDTSLFENDFTESLLASAEVMFGKHSLDDATTGILFHSENFQALSLLVKRYRGRFKCVYIDPPYNTDASPIDYKNGYKTSSWISLMNDRLKATIPTLSPEGVLVAAIDDVQQRELNLLLDYCFYGRVLGTFCVRSNPSGRPTLAGYAVAHEYLLFAGNSPTAHISRMPPTEEQASRFNQQDELGPFEWRNLRREGSNSDRSARPALFYPIYITSDQVRVPRMRWIADEEKWLAIDEPTDGEKIVWPINEDGVEKTWRWEGDTVMANLASVAVRKDRTGADYVYVKRRPNEAGVVSVSTWFDAKYSAVEHGTAVIKSLFGANVFSYPKSLYAVADAIYIGGAGLDRNATILDYFGGSGTTAHAVLLLNRKDKGNRKFVLVEMGNHFNTVLKPRVMKTIYSPDWNSGCAASHDKGFSSLVKIVQLESYEDTLNNLYVRRSAVQESLLQTNRIAREQYMLGYMLNVETMSSLSLLDTNAFSEPNAYTLNIATGTVGETKPTKVDLVETFNWLLGLRVKTMDTIKGVRVVTGTNPQGEKVLILWRSVSEMPNLKLDEFFQKQGYNTKDMEFDVIYVNGDNNLENLKKDEDTWKVRLIEEDFKRLMFDVQDV